MKHGVIGGYGQAGTDAWCKVAAAPRQSSRRWHLAFVWEVEVSLFLTVACTAATVSLPFCSYYCYRCCSQCFLALL